MNKKGQVSVIGIIIFILVMGGILYSSIYWGLDEKVRQVMEKESCNKLGMEYFYQDSIKFCIDNNNQAHYVKIDCEHYGFRKWECNPRIISIGEVRTIQN